MDPAASISVIVPHHNRSHLIFDAIDSIRRQTLQPLEILIVDDGSTPEHRAALDRLTDIARIIHLEKNVGASQARNEGIDRARGEYIAFLDDDDCWMLEKLELQLKILRDDPSLDAVAGAMIIYNEDGSEGLLLSHSSEIMTLNAALEGTPAMLQTVLIRTEVIRKLKGMDPSFRMVSDREFWIRFTAAGCRSLYLSRPLARLNRQEMDRLTRHWKRFTWLEIKVVSKHRELYEKVRGKGSVRREKSKILRRAGIQKGSVAGRLTYIGGCILGAEWRHLVRVLTTGKMVEVPYARG